MFTPIYILSGAIVTCSENFLLTGLWIHWLILTVSLCLLLVDNILFFLFTAQETGYQPTQEMLEQENDRQEEVLSGKVKALKSVSVFWCTKYWEDHPD